MVVRTNAADRARRMMALLPLLTAGAELPLDELASAVGATPAQITADVATLSMCGLPPYSPDELVEAFVEDGVVHVFAGAPALDRPLRLTAAEAAALAAALEACGHGPDDPLREKLLAASATPADAVDLAWAVRAGTSPGGLAEIHSMLAAATAEHEAVRMQYFSAARGEIAERIVEPWAMGVDRGVWYVTGRCRTAGAERVFRLDRIHTLEPLGERFVPPAEVHPPVPAFPAESELHHTTVRFAPGCDVSSREWPGAVFVTADTDDTVGEVPFASPEWVARRVAARLGTAEVVGPEEVRAEVVLVARRILDELDSR